MDHSRFSWKPSDIKHRLFFDSGTGELFGLVRELVIRFREHDDGTVTPFITVSFLDVEYPGQECEIAYESDEVAFIDVHPEIRLTTAELQAHLDGFAEDLRFVGERYGCDSKEYDKKKTRYDSLVEDVRDIMCANRIFRLEDFQLVIAQHFLAGLA
jgi:hypothetical protein